MRFQSSTFCAGSSPFPPAGSEDQESAFADAFKPPITWRCWCARAVTAKGTNLGEYLTKFMEADVSGGLLAMATGQYAAANSMWVIENHPEPLDYFPYHSVLYTFINPIPRVLTGIVAAALALTSARAQTTSRYQSSIANNMPTLKDTARDATLISPSLAPVVSSSPLQRADDLEG